ncbi:hypothetical protein AU255_10470 [Methyloprofundus sedimenti]|uniref:Doubled CXXCH motif domain-containing protein n=2 Tax=Methyloprofundus sedimenti TaxID=1420851 RepID=A0A1V8M9F6_9GAMM|nr:hypothetical protein AU255_10470 [Methyloprofundus sedimenti]
MLSNLKSKIVFQTLVKKVLHLFLPLFVFFCRLLAAIFLILLPTQVVSAAQQIPMAKERIEIQSNFNQPSDIVSDAQGLLYVLDGLNSRIVVLSTEGQLIREINTAKTKHRFDRAMALAIDNNVLYVADTLQHKISCFSLQGKWLGDFNLTAPVSLEAEDGSKVQETKEPKSLSALPEPVSLLVRENELIYADRRWHRICYLELSGGKEKHCVGERGEMEGQFQFPFQIAQDRDGYLNVVDVLNARVQVFDRGGRYYSQTGRFSLDKMYRPNGNVFDALDYQYISDSYLGTISLYYQGRFLGLLQDMTGQVIKLTTPSRLFYDPSGYLYVVDSQANLIQKIQLGYQVLVSLPEQQKEISRKNCVVCHFSWGNNDDVTKMLDSENVLPVASVNMCYSCHHGAVFDSRQAIPFGHQHPTVYDTQEKKQTYYKEPLRKDKIPELYPHSDKNDLSCTSCHTPHNDNEQPQSLYEENHNAWLRGTDYGSEQCEACHEKNTKKSGREDAGQFGLNHPLGVKMQKPEKKAQHLSTDDPHLQKGLPKILLAGGGVLAKDDAIACQSCHQVHEGKTKNLLTQTDENGALCASCHKRQAPKDEKAARKAGVHPVNVELEEALEIRGVKVKTVQCSSCHSVHKGTLGTALYTDKIKDAEKLCLDCHERQHAKDEKDAAKKGIHPMNLELDEVIKIAGVEVKKIGCLSCHAVHSGKPNTPALLQDHRDGQLCENCHAGKQRLIGTDHDLRVSADETQNQQEETALQSGACGACHTLHRGEAKSPFLSSVINTKVQARDKTAPGFRIDEMCMNCHQKDSIGKEKPIAFYGHPYQDMVLRSDEKVMPLVETNHEKISELGAIACITCHDPHSWKPLIDSKEKDYPVLDYKKQENIEGDISNSFLRHKGVEKTFCVDCHGIEALSKYKYYHHEDKVRGIGVDYLK